MENFEATQELIFARNDIIANKLDKIGPDMRARLEQIASDNRAKQDTLGPAAAAAMNNTMWTAITISIIALIFGGIIGLFLARSITRPITSMTDAMARLVLRNSLFWGRGKASALTIPWATYTEPEVAHVGLTPKRADELGIDIDTFAFEFDHLDRAILDGETEGFFKVHVRKGKDEIVGATMVSAHAGESIGEVALAMQAGAGLGTLASTIHPYPTQAEAIKRVADAWSRTRLTPTVARIFAWLLRRQRS